jgi:succinate dehydrogenase / fumarate reductase cytochrome b subunit
MIFLRYKWRTGMAAWALHRLSGLALIFYLTLHIWVTHNLGISQSKFNFWMDLLSSPIFKLLEIGLLGVVLYHALNGLRIILIDLGWGVKYHKAVFWGLVLIGGVAFLAGGYELFPFK